LCTVVIRGPSKNYFNEVVIETLRRSPQFDYVAFYWRL